MLKPTTLSGKLRTAFFLIALVPVLIIGVVTYLRLRTATIERETQSLFAIAESRRLALDIWIEGLRLRVSSIRSVPAFAAFAQAQPGGSAAAARQLDASLREAMPSKEDINGIYLFSPDGRLVYSYAASDIDRNASYAREELFVRGGMDEYFSGVMVSPVSKSRCFIFSSPIRGANGAMLAVLGVEVGLDRLMRIFGTQGETMQGVALSLLNLDGTVMYQSTGPIHFPIVQRKRSEGIADLDRRKAVSGLFTDSDGRSVVATYLLYPERRWIIAAELETSAALRTANLLLYTDAVVLLLLAIVILIVARHYGNRFAGPIVSLSGSAQLIAQGDLRKRVPVASGDEVGALASSFNEMVDSLATINSRMLTMSSDIDRAAKDILGSSSQQEQITLQQSSAVSETSATVEELSVSAKQVSLSAQSIMQQVEGTAAKIMYFSQKAQEINKISAVIDEIAQQIHLLSLNASIESARAGEHGRGFGVVAAEIRKLSENANRQTSEISAIVQDIQDAISTVVLATEQAVNGVRSITISVQEQDTATEQIATAMQDINTGMKQSLDGTKRTLRSVEELNAVMNAMDELVRHFKL